MINEETLRIRLTQHSELMLESLLPEIIELYELTPEKLKYDILTNSWIKRGNFINDYKFRLAQIQEKHNDAQTEN